jgi:hypothetical protein
MYSIHPSPVSPLPEGAHMSATAAAFAEDPPPRPTPFETAFIRTVLEHRGTGFRPSLAELSAAHDVLRRFNDQCLDNPGGGAWEPRLDEDSVASLRAKAFIMFGATKPTPAQWQKAHAALFGPLLCETCG